MIPAIAIAAGIAATGTGGLGTVAAAEAADGYEEALVKAEFVERFTRFVEWPRDSLGSSFVIGAFGDDPVGRALGTLASSRTIKDRPVEVRRLSRAAEARSCHLVWIPSGRRPDLPGILASARGQPVLTVGDSEGFARAGVHINLVRDGDRLGFEINLDEARRSGLDLSSKLLRLGTIVGDAR